MGGFKTVTAVAKSENEESIKEFVKKHITEGAMVSADENRSYEVLHAHYKMERVNHSEEYFGANGESTNQAESFSLAFVACSQASIISSATCSTIWLKHAKTEL